MKKRAITILFASLATLCVASLVSRFDAVDFLNIEPVTTGGNHTVCGRTNICGKVSSIAVRITGATPTVDVSIATTEDIGSSLGGQKVLFTATDLETDIVTNLENTTFYLYDDIISVFVTNQSEATATAAVHIIFER